MMQPSRPSRRPARLEALPLLILELICDALANCDRHKRSLCALSLVSKTCCFATEGQRFQRVWLVVRDADGLRRSLDSWCQRLRVDGRFRHVRFVKVAGGIPLDPGESWVGHHENPTHSADGEVDFQEVSYDFDIAHAPKSPTRFHRTGVRISTQGEKRRRNADWLPLAQFIAKLPGLRDMVYTCYGPIAPCVVSALRQHCPTSRLHLRELFLDGFVQYQDEPNRVDPDDLALATSPCLYSIYLQYPSLDRYDGYKRTTGLDYHEVAVMRMAAGLAPNLTHVHMSYPNTVPLGLEDDLSVLPRSLGPLSTPIPKRGGRLMSLTLDGDGSARLGHWRRCLDLTKLRSLDLGKYATALVLDRLADMGGELAALRSLVMCVGPEQIAGDEAALDLATSHALRCLRPLERLHLRGRVADLAYAAVMERHGGTLRNLRFQPSGHCLLDKRGRARNFVLSSSRVRSMARRCTSLEQLDVTVPRTHGDTREVTIYETLGRLPRLRHLALVLDCGRSEPPDPDPGEPWVRLGNATVTAPILRDALANAALDWRLAVSVFRTIGGSSLRLLSLRTVGTCDFDGEDGPAGLLEPEGQVMRWISRQWEVSGDVCGTPVATERCMEDRLDAGGRVTRLCNGQRPREAIISRAWSSLWPATDEPWWDDWYSFPLAGGGPRYAGVNRPTTA